MCDLSNDTEGNFIIDNLIYQIVKVRELSSNADFSRKDKWDNLIFFLEDMLDDILRAEYHHISKTLSFP